MRFGLVLACLVTACRPGPEAPAPGAEKVVARIDGKVITVGDLDRRLGELDPFSRARFSSPEFKKRMLDNLIQFEVMAREAQLRGYDKDPEVQRVLKERLIARLIDKEIDDKLKPESIPEAEVEAYYKAHIDRFRRPEQVRVSQVFTTDRAKAQKVASEARSARTDKGFLALVDAYSEDEDSKMRGGDLTFFDRESSTLPRTLVEAAFALRETHDVSGVVNSDKGFHVLRLTQRRPGFTRPLDEVKNDVRRMILGELRAKKIEELVTEMRKKIKVEVFEDQLGKVKVVADGGGN